MIHSCVSWELCIYIGKKRCFAGVCAITINSDWSEPQDANNADDVTAAERLLQCKFGWFANPIFGSDGDYPDVMKKQLAKKCAELGLPHSTLPEFTAEEKKLNKGTAAFRKLNVFSYHTLYMYI